MRRLLIGLTLAAIIVVSVAVGVVVADWPFYQRLAHLPQTRGTGEWPESFYRPIAVVQGPSAPFFPAAGPGEQSIDPAALAQAEKWAGEHASVALIVIHRGRVQLEKYWEDMGPDRLYSGRAMTRTMVAFLYGIAMADGTIRSLDEPVETWLDEWRGEARGRITLRQLMQNVSGLEEVPLSGGSVFDKNGRLALSGDFAGAALAFGLADPPGSRFAFSNANSQLLGVVLERATGRSYESFLEERLWKPLGAGRGELYMDRDRGMPAVYCCFRASPRDFARLGALLLDDGSVGGVQVLPHGWIAEMAKTSSANPLYGLQLWSGRARAGVREYSPGNPRSGYPHSEGFLADMLWMEGGGGRSIWAVPSQQLLIVRLGRASPGWDASYLPNTILRGVR